jgi:hypothetical protein
MPLHLLLPPKELLLRPYLLQRLLLLLPLLLLPFQRPNNPQPS